MLPFGKEPFPVQRSKFGVAQPHSRKVRFGVAGLRHGFDAEDAVFSAILPGAVYAQLMKTPEIVFRHRRNDCSTLRFRDESLERLEQSQLIVRHKNHPN